MKQQPGHETQEGKSRQKGGRTKEGRKEHRQREVVQQKKTKNQKKADKQRKKEAHRERTESFYNSLKSWQAKERPLLTSDNNRDKKTTTQRWNSTTIVAEREGEAVDLPGIPS